MKAHTIRIWEQRYNALLPGRSEGNTRFYNGDQLKRLLNMVSLIRADYKVADVCSMTDKRLADEVKKHKQDSSESQNAIVSSLLVAGLKFDEAAFDRTFDHATKRLDFQEVYTEIIYPLIERLGLLWAENTIIPSQEHFITHLIRQKIIGATNELGSISGKQNWLLFLPEDEFHEIGLLFANYLIRLSGRKTFYFGANLPLTTLEQAVHSVKPDFVLFFSVRNEEPSFLNSYLEQLMLSKSIRKIFLAKRKEETDKHLKTKKVNFLYSVEELENILG